MNELFTFIDVSRPAKLVAGRFEPQNEFYHPPNSQKFAPTLGLDV